MSKIDSIVRFFEKLNDSKISRDIDLTKFTTIRVETKGTVVFVNTVEALQKTVKFLNENEVEFVVLGLGSNLIIENNEKRIFLKVDFPFDKTLLDNFQNEYVLPASVPLSILSSHAIRNNIAGWEVFTGIPANVGGAVFMNAGTNLGEISEVIEEVSYVKKDGSLRTIKNKEGLFSYRSNNFLLPGEVIYSVKLSHKGQDPKIGPFIRNYLKKRNLSQPLKEFTCGCVFKNFKGGDITCPAGKFIDIIGLKGLTYKGVRVSHKHGNFMENFNNAKSEDVIELISIVQEELYLQFGVNFEKEVQIS